MKSHEERFQENMIKTLQESGQLPPDRMTMHSYAAHRGVAVPSLRYAIKARKLGDAVIQEDGKIWIDVAKADRNWNPKLDARRKTNWGKELADQAPQEGGDGVPDYATSKAKREAALASLAELELEKERGKLIDAEEVRKSAFNAARMVRNGMLNIPDRVAAEFAAETDVFKITTRLREEIRKALEGLGKEEE